MHQRIARALRALPFLSISISCFVMMDGPRLVEMWEPAFLSGKITWNGGTITLLRNFYYIDLVDQTWRGLTVTFAPATLGFDPVGWWTGFEFLTQLAPLYAIWMLEARRLVNQRSPAGFATIFMFLGQFLGTGFIVPLFHFLVHGFSPPITELVEPSSDRQHIQNPLLFSSTPFILPLVLLFHLVGVTGAFLAPHPQTRHTWVWIWLFLPVWMGFADGLLARMTFSVPKSDRRTITCAERQLGVLAVMCSSIWVYMLAYSPYSLSVIFVPEGFTHDDLFSHSRFIWQIDNLCTFGSAVLSVVYTYIDLYQFGLLENRDWLLATIFPAVAVGSGPGIALVVAWLWENKVIRRKLDGDAKSN